MISFKPIFKEKAELSIVEKAIDIEIESYSSRWCTLEIMHNGVMHRKEVTREQAQAINDYVCQKVNCNLTQWWIGSYRFEIVENGVTKRYTQPHQKQEEVKAGLTKYILENHSDLIEEMIK
jgi:hypothetical protein